MSGVKVRNNHLLQKILDSIEEIKSENKLIIKQQKNILDFLQIQTNTNDEIINVLNSQNDLILNKRINNHLFDNKIIESNLDDLSKKSNIVIKNVNDNSNNVPCYNNQFLIKNNNQSTNKEILQNNDNANELIQKQTEILKKYRYY
jgi:hypothetical protein